MDNDPTVPLRIRVVIFVSCSRVYTVSIFGLGIRNAFPSRSEKGGRGMRSLSARVSRYAKRKSNK